MQEKERKEGKLLNIIETKQKSEDGELYLTYVTFLFENGKIDVTLDCNERLHKLKIIHQTP